MSLLLAIDPGLLKPAAAIFSNRILVAAERVSIPKSLAGLSVGQRSLEVSRLILEWYESRGWHGAPDTLVIEWPQVYQRAKSKGDPADLLPLAGVGMCIAGLLNPGEVRSPTPGEWIGQLPKSTTGNPWASARGQRIGNRLSDVERAAIVPSHDAIDAAGLGLWALGRLDRIRVFPGATS